MKKKEQLLIRHVIHLKNLLQMITVLMLVISTTWAGEIYAGQISDAQSINSVKISFQFKDTSLKSVVDEIEKNTDFRFAYEPSLNLKDIKGINISADEVSVAMVLREVSVQTGLSFRQINNSISIKKNENEFPELKTQPAEKQKIKGKVTDINGEPLFGANVFIASLSIGAATEVNGEYEFEDPVDGKEGEQFEIRATYIGYKTQTKISNYSSNTLNIDFVLEEDIFQSEAVVVTGIASKRSKAVSEVAVSRLPVEDLTSKQLYTNLDQLLNGKVAGVQLHPSAGYVGGGYRFFIRGGGGLNGTGQPIIYVDGVRIDDSDFQPLWDGGQDYSNLLSLSPNDIENIEVLKGPAAAAMYGTDGSNGIVLITTKTGKAGREGMSVNYHFDYGVNSSSIEYDPNKYYNADLYNNNILQDGLIRNHSINISGGTGKLNYFASYENKDENGIIGRSFQKRNAGRVNLTAIPNNNITINLNAAYSANELSKPHSDDAVLSPHWMTLMLDTPWKWYDSTAIVSTRHPAENNRFIGGGKVNWLPFENLEITGGFGIDNSYHRQDEIYPPEYIYWMGTGGRKRIAEISITQLTYDFSAKYTYEPLEELKITSAIGSQLFDRKNKYTGMEGRGYTTGLITEIESGAEILDIWEGAGHIRQAGIYTSHSLSYKETYFSTLGLRKDYASAIGAEAPSIYYPQASFAVRLDKLNLTPYVIDMLKLRVAYGESGQLPDISDGKRLLWAATGVPYGAGALPNFMGNPSIKPERIKELELGFDLGVFKDYSIEFTYYSQNSVNSIVSKPNAPSTGLGSISIPYNVGKVEGSGIEFLLQGNPIHTRNFGLDFTFIWNYQKNEVVDLDGQGPLVADYRVNVIEEGFPKWQYYAVRTVGARFNDDGTYAGSIESDGRVDLGSPIPAHTGSFSINISLFKNFKIYAMADWALDKKVFSIFRQFASNNGGYKPFYEMAARLGLTDWAWNSQIDFSDYQQLEPGTPEYIDLANEFARADPLYRGNYIFDADYFVLRELSVSYDLTDLLSEFSLLNSYIKGVTIGLSAKNLLRISKYKDGDFEVNAAGSRSGGWGIDYGTLPQPRVVNFWLNISI